MRLSLLTRVFSLILDIKTYRQNNIFVVSHNCIINCDVYLTILSFSLVIRCFRKIIFLSCLLPDENFSLLISTRERSQQFVEFDKRQ